MLTEERLAHVLQDEGSAKTVDDIKKLIFEEEAADFGSYVTALLAALNCYDVQDTDDATLQVIQDAWNYFPHRFLNGRCPAEIMIED